MIALAGKSRQIEVLVAKHRHLHDGQLVCRVAPQAARCHRLECASTLDRDNAATPLPVSGSIPVRSRISSRGYWTQRAAFAMSRPSVQARPPTTCRAEYPAVLTVAGRKTPEGSSNVEPPLKKRLAATVLACRGSHAQGGQRSGHASPAYSSGLTLSALPPPIRAPDSKEALWHSVADAAHECALQLRRPRASPTGSLCRFRQTLECLRPRRTVWPGWPLAFGTIPP